MPGANRLVIRSPASQPAVADRLPAVLVFRALLIGLALCLVTVLAFHVATMRSRWLQPLLISVPLVVVAWAQPRLTPGRSRVVFVLAGLAMLAVTTVMYGTVVTAGWLGRPTYMNIPYREFAVQMRAAGFTQGVIIAENYPMAGNLRLCFPGSTVLVAGGPVRLPTPPVIRALVLLVWRPGDQTEVPRPLLGFATQEWGLDPSLIRPKKISAPSLYAAKKIQSLGFAVCPPPGDK